MRWSRDWSKRLDCYCHYKMLGHVPDSGRALDHTGRIEDHDDRYGSRICCDRLDMIDRLDDYRSGISHDCHGYFA